MDEPIQCRVCDRLFDPGLDVCPFCGADRLPDTTFEEIVDGSFSRLAETAHGSTGARLDALLNRLELLEEDLDALLADGIGSTAGIDR